MTGSEVMRAFDTWRGVETRDREPISVYPLFIRTGDHSGCWYVRERLPGTRVWRAEEEGRFTLLEHSAPRSIDEIFRLAALD